MYSLKVNNSIFKFQLFRVFLKEMLQLDYNVIKESQIQQVHFAHKVTKMTGDRRGFYCDQIIQRVVMTRSRLR